jgi:hypothetical protein
MANLTPLALATLYALAKGNKDEDGTAPAQAQQAPQAAPAMPAPVNIQRPRTDMSQMFGATQDTEDMEAAPQVKNPVGVKPSNKRPVAPSAVPVRPSANDPGVVQRFIASQSAPNQSDAETRRLQAQNTQLADYNPKSDYGTDIDYDLYERKLPKNKNNQIDIDQFINNVKKQDKAEGIPRTPEQYDAIRKIALKKYPNDYIQSGQPKAEPVKKTYKEFGSNKVHTYEETPEKEASSSRHPRTGREYAKGGSVKAYAKGGQVSASKRGDGIASKGHTRGKMV